MWRLLGAVFVLVGLLNLLAVTEARGDARPTNPGFGPETIEVLPYRSPGYRYKIIGTNDLPTRGFEKPGFNDSGWQAGDSAFGSGGVLCPDTTKLLVRKTFQVPARARNVRVLIAVDDDIVGVFFNGRPLPGYHFHKGCPALDEFRFDVPQSLVRTGTNVIALQLRDRGGSSFFDVSVLAERSLTTATVPVCTAKQMQSWKFINDQQQGVAGKDRLGPRTGKFPAERTFLGVDTWYPADGYKHTLCGRLHHFNFYNSFITRTTGTTSSSPAGATSFCSSTLSSLD